MATLSAGVQAKTASTAAPLDFAALPRTYESALHLLSLLPTNRDVTVLFEAPPVGEDGTGKKKAVDFNALALPEVVAWMARAGYADLATDLAGLKCIHVTGTKGKGSVCAFATALLVGSKSAGVGRVGTYLSPHVVSVRERIWLDGAPIGRDLFAQYTFELWERLSRAALDLDGSETAPYGPHTKPFYFRFLTLLALHVFVREGVQSAVVECGIGGEYDATNVLPPSSVTATAVTRLGIDHVAMLGRTVEEIAWHKAGIFKKGAAAFTLQGAASSPSDEDTSAVLTVLRARAAEKQARSGVLYEVPPAAVAAWDGVSGAALPGSFQKYNMALAAAAARYHIQHLQTVSGAGGPVAEADMAALLDPATMPEAMRTALSRASLRARCEAVSVPLPDGKQPIAFVVDGAHTADSLSEVAGYFAGATTTTASVNPPPRRVLLFSVRDRDPYDLVRAVVAGAGPSGFFADAVFVFPPEAAESIEHCRRAMHAVSPTTTVHASDSTADAIKIVKAFGGDAPLHVLAAGSFVLAREVLEELGEGSEAG